MKTKIFLCLSIFALVFFFTGSETADAKRPQAVIVDTDIGNSTDDLFALDFLYKLSDEGKSDIKAIMVSREGYDYAALADIENTFYGHPNIPIGIERDGVKDSEIYIDYRLLDNLTDKNGGKLFRRTDTDMSDNLDGYKLYRKILADSENKSVKLIVVGFVSNVVKLLESAPDEYSPLPGKELVRQKVSALYFMGTKFGDNNDVGYNLWFDMPLAKRFVTEWPQSVTAYLSPSPVGDGLDYRPELVLDDFSDADVHPVKEVYLNKDCDTGQRMWDVLCVINAFYPKKFTYSKRGFVSLTDDGKAHFTASPKGNFIYQTAGDEKWNEEMLAFIRKFAKKRN